MASVLLKKVHNFVFLDATLIALLTELLWWMMIYYSHEKSITIFGNLSIFYRKFTIWCMAVLSRPTFFEPWCTAGWLIELLGFSYKGYFILDARCVPHRPYTRPRRATAPRRGDDQLIMHNAMARRPLRCPSLPYPC